MPTVAGVHMSSEPDVETPTWTVSQVAQGVQGAVSAAFPDTIWVSGVVADKRPGLARGGWLRFTLTETRDNATIVAKMSAVVTPRRVADIRRSLLKARVKLSDGVPVRVRARCVYTPGFGSVQLEVVEVDAEYTVGRLVVDRDTIIAALGERGVLAAQKKLTVPALPLKVALITSATSAAHADFTEHLAASGFAFETVCFDTAVQGASAVASIVDRIGRVATSFATWTPDVVVIARGGGARTDLATFDDPAIAEAIAACAVPVLCGIGHEIDHHIADLAAHRSFKTPTDVAQGIISRVQRCVDDTAAVAARVGVAARTTLERADARSADMGARTHSAASARLERATRQLDDIDARMFAAAYAMCDRADSELEHTAQLVKLWDPQKMLERGWSWTTTSHGVLLSADVDITDNMALRTRYSGGTVTSVVHLDDNETKAGQ